jgi:hypothetical protein
MRIRYKAGVAPLPRCTHRVRGMSDRCRPAGGRHHGRIGRQVDEQLALRGRDWPRAPGRRNLQRPPARVSRHWLSWSETTKKPSPLMARSVEEVVKRKPPCSLMAWRKCGSTTGIELGVAGLEHKAGEFHRRALGAGGARVGDIVGNRAKPIGLRRHTGRIGPHHVVKAHRVPSPHGSTRTVDQAQLVQGWRQPRRRP